MDLGALAVWYKEMLLREVCVELSKTPADARAEKRSLGDVERVPVLGRSECHFQVQKDVGRGCRGCTAVLVASCSDCYGDLLSSGIL